MKNYLILLLLLIASAIWISVFSLPDNNLHIITCDIGQGDAILLFRGATQVLIDGGPDNKVLTCLSKYMPYWDNNIDIVVSTHPDSDHSTGLIEVLRRYKVNYFLQNNIVASTNTYSLLEKILGGTASKIVNPKIGEQIKVSDMDFLVVNALGMDSPQSKVDTNDTCIVLYLKYLSFTGIFTCDVSPKAEDEIIAEGHDLRSVFLKVPHHGSKNGLTQQFLDYVNPKISSISVGAKNRYGHPSPEIIEMLLKKGVITKRTDLEGSIELVTDGQKYWLK